MDRFDTFRRTGTLILVVAAVAVAGCGGGGPEAPDSGVDTVRTSGDATGGGDVRQLDADGISVDAGDVREDVDTCVPDCDGKECGSDGCGGTCGSCAKGQNCTSQNVCEYPSKTFEDDVYPILDEAGCANGSCHGYPAFTADLDLMTKNSAYQSLVGTDSSQCADRKLVEKGGPDASYLVHKLEGTDLCDGGRMPAGDNPPLSDSQIDTVRAWIGNGAPEK